LCLGQMSIPGSRFSICSVRDRQHFVRMRRTLNLIVSVGVVVLGFLLWRYPESPGFPPDRAWYGLVVVAYGLLRAYVFWRRSGPGDAGR